MGVVGDERRRRMEIRVRGNGGEECDCKVRLRMRFGGSSWGWVGKKEGDSRTRKFWILDLFGDKSKLPTL